MNCATEGAHETRIVVLSLREKLTEGLKHYRLIECEIEDDRSRRSVIVSLRISIECDQGSSGMGERDIEKSYFCAWSKVLHTSRFIPSLSHVRRYWEKGEYWFNFQSTWNRKFSPCPEKREGRRSWRICTWASQGIFWKSDTYFMLLVQCKMVAADVKEYVLTWGIHRAHQRKR